VSVTLWLYLQRRFKTFCQKVSVTLWFSLQCRCENFCFVCFFQPALCWECVLVLRTSCLLAKNYFIHSLLVSSFTVHYLLEYLGEEKDFIKEHLKWRWIHSHVDITIEKEVVIALVRCWISKGRRSMIPKELSISDMEIFIWTTSFNRNVICEFSPARKNYYIQFSNGEERDRRSAKWQCLVF